MPRIRINRSVVLEICHEPQSLRYSFTNDPEYRKFLLAIGKVDSSVMRDIFLQLRGRNLLNTERLLML